VSTINGEINNHMIQEKEPTKNEAIFGMDDSAVILSYIDVNGAASKPFVLPQKDSGYYEKCLRTFSVPELVVEPVRTTKETLGKVVRGKIDKIVYVPISSATNKNDKWQERE